MKNKSEFFSKYKIIVIILYFFFSLPGLSILFLFPPQKLLFNENSEDDKIKLSLFKFFVKNIYENIKKPLIKEMIFTEENEACPTDFEELVIVNQYYGNFSKFYGNASFCIKKFDDEKYNYEKLLFKNDEKCDSGYKSCGRLNRYSNIPLCIDNNIECPLNKFDMDGGGKDSIKYIIPGGQSYFIPYYGDDQSQPVIVDIEIINNDRLCLERHNREKKFGCEFPDNNHCFIYVGYDEVSNRVLSEQYKFYPNNLAKWNLIHDENIEHEFCNEKQIFHIYTSGYINFTHQNLEEFKSEFPPGSDYDNPLYNSYKAFKSPHYLDLFFYLLSLILFCWSLTHFVLQILIFFKIQKIRKFYIYNGIILFFAKLISFFGMIINHYFFYLKIKKVHVILIDEPYNKVLNKYSSTRNILIAKIFIIWIVGIIVLLIDLLILIFNYLSKWGLFFRSLKLNKQNNQELECKNINCSEECRISNNLKDKEEPKTFINEKKPIYEIKSNNNSSNPEEISIQFAFKENLSKIYDIKIGENEPFNNALKKLEETYSELKEKNMKVFCYESLIINKLKTISENGITDKMKIIILS